MTTPFTQEQVSTIDRIIRRAGIGVVYMIAADEVGPVKIGKSTFLAQRLATLQTGNPRQLHVYAAYLMKHGQIQVAESRLHAALDDAWLMREWFSLSVSDARTACKRALRLAARIQSEDQRLAERRLRRVRSGTSKEENKKPTNYKRLRERRLSVLREMYPNYPKMYPKRQKAYPPCTHTNARSKGPKS